jgi:ribosomal protein S27E
MKKSTKSSPAPKGYKKMQCKYCENICQRVDEKVTAVTCSICTSKLVNGQTLELRK